VIFDPLLSEINPSEATMFEGEKYIFALLAARFSFNRTLTLTTIFLFAFSYPSISIHIAT
jgi:hypothetical protein